MNVRLVRDGELPPDVVDGYCTRCCQDVVVVAPKYICEACGEPVHPDSLPRADRLAVLGQQPAAKPADVAPEPRTPAKPVLLPRVDDLVKWHRETVFRRNRLAEQEQELEAVRRARKALDRVLEAIQLEPEEDDDGN